MISPDLSLHLYHQRHEELMHQAEQARLVRASKQTRVPDTQIFQPFLWWIGSTLFSWGCALQRTGRARAAEKGCGVCL